jgi:dTMP kinase
MSNIDRGLFIVIEGGHGSGKTTVVRHLTDLLSQENHSVIATHEIGGSEFGDQVRRLVDEIDDEEDAEVSLLMVLAARAKHVRQLIRPNLAQGRIVITDRFTPSTYVYQYYCVERFSHQRELLETVRLLNDFATGGLFPHATMVLDIPADIALSRKGCSTGKWERKNLKYHQKARDGYLHFAGLEGWNIVNANQPLEMVLREVQELVSPLLIKA